MFVNNYTELKQISDRLALYVSITLTTRTPLQHIVAKLRFFVKTFRKTETVTFHFVVL